MNYKLVIFTIIVLGIIIVAGSFLVAPSASFDSELPTLNSINQKAGLSSAPLHKSVDSLFLMESSKLSSLKADLRFYNEQAKTASAKQLSKIYIDLVDFVTQFNSVQAMNNSIDIQSDFCSNLSKFKEINEKILSLGELQAGISTEIDTFISQYPTQAQQIDLYNNPASSLPIYYHSQNSDLLALAEADCA